MSQKVCARYIAQRNNTEIINKILWEELCTSREQSFLLPAVFPPSTLKSDCQ